MTRSTIINSRCTSGARCVELRDQISRIPKKPETALLRAHLTSMLEREQRRYDALRELEGLG